MAQLFSIWTLKHNTKVLNWFDQSKIDIVQDLHTDYKNWLLDDEVKYKEKFNKVFFWDLLWYEDRIHRIPEWTISWVWNADIILWNFVDGKEDAELIQIACELKWSKSNLVKKQYWHWWLSPVGQWFSYKTGLKNCKRLIVSNFFETRIYRDNQTDFEIWDLKMLLDPKDDYFNLRSLYLLLHKDNLLSDNWTSKTEDLLSHFRDEQLEITKKFYKEYKQLRLDLLQDVRKRNPSLSVNTLVEKAQKIVDRLIFIFFCEDRGLLPDKKLKEWIQRAGEFDISPREMTKRFFKWVDQGSVKLEIPGGYNWGLFKDDFVLNNLNVWDEICKKFVELTNYDFHDDLSVNVLWHIFEQSISDLEEIKEDLIWKESKVLQESKWRRKKDGIFYTPEYIVDYIVQNSVMKYLNEKEDECLKKYKNKKNWETLAYQEYQHILQHIKVLDPACGSGAFLVRVFDVLFEENKRVGSILNSLFDDTQAYKNILTNNIYGVDLNDESVEITKLSLRLKSAQKWKKLNNLDSNIKCGNSLIDDIEVAGDKAFDWNIEFKEIMDDWGFDVIVWNPPYWAQLNSIEKIFCQKTFKVFQWNFEVYFFFIENAKLLLKENWILGFITPDTWIRIPQAQILREFVLNFFTINKIVSFWYPVFEEAAVNTIIFIIIHSSKNDSCRVINIEDINNINKLTNEQFYKCNVLSWQTSSDKQFQILQTDNEQKVIKKLLKNNAKWEDILDISQWIVPYSTETLTKEEVKNRIYHENNKLDNTYWIWAQGRCLSRYWLNMSSIEYIKYWSRLHRPRKEKYFNGERLLIQEITWWNPARISATTYSDTLFHDPGIISCLNKSDLDIKYILSIINSKLISWYHEINSPKWNRKTFPKVLIWDIRKLPIKEISPSEQQPFIDRADKMLSLNKEFHEKIDMILKFLQQKYWLEKISKKLQKFYELDFKDFVKQLKIKSISMEEERELMQLFEKDKAEVLVLKEEIDSTDREIDEMVFELYGLSEEERRVVLDG